MASGVVTESALSSPEVSCRNRPVPRTVNLTWGEVMMAANVAIMRQVQNLRFERPDRHGCSPDGGWTEHVNGALGEMAVAKLAGLFWSGSLGRLLSADVGFLQVRTTPRDGGSLILHDNDGDFEAYILVTGRISGAEPRLTVRGYLSGVAGKSAGWWRDIARNGRPAYFVPQSALRDIGEILPSLRIEEGSCSRP